MSDNTLQKIRNLEQDIVDLQQLLRVESSFRSKYELEVDAIYKTLIKMGMLETFKEEHFSGGREDDVEEFTHFMGESPLLGEDISVNMSGYTLEEHKQRVAALREFNEGE